VGVTHGMQVLVGVDHIRGNPGALIGSECAPLHHPTEIPVDGGLELSLPDGSGKPFGDVKIVKFHDGPRVG